MMEKKGVAVGIRSSGEKGFVICCHDLTFNSVTMEAHVSSTVELTPRTTASPYPAANSDNPTFFFHHCIRPFRS